MSLLTREHPEPFAVDLEPGASPASAAVTVGTDVRAVLAACSLGAAAIHFGYAPAHLAEYWLQGVFFLGLAWWQLLWAAAVVLRPRRWVFAVGIVANAAVIAVWAFTRTRGVWLGPHANVKEAVTFPDILATTLEALVIVGAVLALAAPKLLGWPMRRRWPSAIAVGAAVVLVGGSAGYGMSPRFVAAHSHTHVAAGLTGSTPCEKAGPPASQGQVFDSAGHFHRGPSAQQPIDAATHLQLQRQQEAARAVAAKYPTVVDAERGGYRISTPYIPCIGAHYTNVPLAASFDPAAPSELLYDGTTPTSHIVGLSYLVFHQGGAPEGFPGPNDAWHQHTFNGGLCLNGEGIVIGAESMSAAECTARGGAKIPLTDVWMLHDWVVPGFECSWGVFAAECPELGGRTGGSAWDAPDPRQQPVPLG
jgi:hypothetical protein